MDFPLFDLHYLVANHFFEYTVAVLPFFVFLAKYKDNLRYMVIILEAVIVISRIAMLYYKNVPDRKSKFKSFIGNAMQHYLHTHPRGKEISKESNFDEKVDSLFGKYKLQHDSEVDGLG